MFFFTPPEKFSAFFREQARLIQAAAAALYKNIQANNTAELGAMAQDIAALEDQCDRIKRETVAELSQTFITPFDPEDLLAMARHLDDVMDGIEESAYCLSAYKVHDVPPAIIQMCFLLDKASQSLVYIVARLPKLDDVPASSDAIFELEKQADDIQRKAVADLFAAEPDPVNLVKLREIYGALEQTMDACAHVAGTLQYIKIKNS